MLEFLTKFQQGADFTKKLISESQNSVRIAFDGDLQDQYERYLAMVYCQTSKGEIWLNLALVQEGLANAYLKNNFSQKAKDEFKSALNSAKSKKKNLWA